jgi:hypothetical protein
MTSTRPKHRASPRLAAGIAISAFFALGTFVVPANADDHHGYDRGRREDRGHDYDGNRGYYPAPPVVYGSPYYAPPPVVYGPAVGVYLPGVSIGIR